MIGFPPNRDIDDEGRPPHFSKLFLPCLFKGFNPTLAITIVKGLNPTLAINAKLKWSEMDFPVVDLSVLNPSDLQADKSVIMNKSPLVELISKIRDACQEAGFFYVINHGIEEQVTKAVESVARDVFTVPSEAREKAKALSMYTHYKRAYAESVNIDRVVDSDSAQQVSDVLWPHGNPKFCKAIEEYSSKMEALAMTLMKLLVLSLGFDTSSEYYQSFFQKTCEAAIRLTLCTPPPNRQEGALVLGSHTDASFIAILYHDVLAGLEFQTKEGDWAPVKPVPNSFVVVLGDPFEIWSNFRYVSTPHRVIDGGWSSRLNVAVFLQCKEDAELYAPEQLVDEEHPRRFFVPFLFKDYKDFKYQYMFTWPKEKETNTFIPPSSARVTPTPTPTPIPLLS